MTTRRYAFLRGRRWIGLALVAVVAAVTCVFLGIWQFGRHEDRAAANQLVIDNYDAAAAPIESLLGEELTITPEQVWRPVTVTGQYVGNQVLVRNRSVDGRPAMRVLAVFSSQLADGRQLDIVIDRGSVDSGTEPQDAPGYPTGTVELTGRLRLAEPADSRTPPPGQVFRIDPATVIETSLPGTARVGTPVHGYVMLAAEEPPAAVTLPQLPRPETDPGSHLSYAFQWWFFSLVGPVGFVVLARREAADLAADLAQERAAGQDVEHTIEEHGQSGERGSEAGASQGSDHAGTESLASGEGASAHAGERSSGRAGSRRRPRRHRPDDAEEDALIDAQLEAMRSEAPR